MEETHGGVWAVVGSDSRSSVCGYRGHCQGPAGAMDAGAGNEQTDDEVFQDGVDHSTEDV